MYHGSTISKLFLQRKAGGQIAPFSLKISFLQDCIITTTHFCWTWLSFFAFNLYRSSMRLLLLVVNHLRAKDFLSLSLIVRIAFLLSLLLDGITFNSEVSLLIEVDVRS